MSWISPFLSFKDQIIHFSLFFILSYYVLFKDFLFILCHVYNLTSLTIRFEIEEVISGSTGNWKLEQTQDSYLINSISFLFLTRKRIIRISYHSIIYLLEARTPSIIIDISPDLFCSFFRIRALPFPWCPGRFRASTD